MNVYVVLRENGCAVDFESVHGSYGEAQSHVEAIQDRWERVGYEIKECEINVPKGWVFNA